VPSIGCAGGSRESVVAALRRTRVNRGLLGRTGFNSEGDMTRAPVTVFRVQRGGGSELVSSTEGAETLRTINVPSELLR
jgi:hypothetical protein